LQKRTQKAMMKKKNVFICICTTILGCAESLAKPVTYLWDYASLVAVQQQPKSTTYRDMVAQANEVLRHEVLTVTQKEYALSGDRHNYESLATYYWPNPANPSGPYVARDGEQNPETDKYDFPRLLALASDCAALGKAFFLTGNDVYYNRLCRQLDAWFIDEATRMNPHFSFSQFIPGVNGNKGTPGGVLDAYWLMDVLESIQLTDYTRSLGRKRMRALKIWFNDLATWMVESENGRRAAQFGNNHAIAYQGTLLGIYLFAGKGRGQRTAIKAFGQLVVEQINEDGRMPNELKRNNALTYSVFNLNHILDVCTMAHAAGLKVPEEASSRIDASCSYLSTFIGHRERFPYKEIGNWEVVEKNLKRELQRKERFR
jgi:hypothetical protein